MAISTLTQQSQDHKPCKAFYATIDETHGVLTKLDDGIIYFLADDGELLEFTPEMATFTVTHGEVGIGDTQRVLDDIRGLAYIATHRNN